MDYSATIGMNLYDSGAKKIGMVAFELDLETMSEPLRDIQAPFGGHFVVASKKGDVILHPNSQEIFHRETPQRWLKIANEYEGNFYDEETNQYVYYRTFSLPSWVAFTVVDASKHEEFINRAPTGISAFIITGTCPETVRWPRELPSSREAWRRTKSFRSTPWPTKCCSNLRIHLMRPTAVLRSWS